MANLQKVNLPKSQVAKNSAPNSKWPKGGANVGSSTNVGRCYVAILNVAILNELIPRIGIKIKENTEPENRENHRFPLLHF